MKRQICNSLVLASRLLILILTLAGTNCNQTATLLFAETIPNTYAEMECDRKNGCYPDNPRSSSANSNAPYI